MSLHEALRPQAPDPRLGGVIKLAIMAVGGQGGGVLTRWIEDMARANGYAVQATSVAGVAQRTGATIYYLEMAPLAARQPVFSLAPSAGDVDVLLAAEWMEAGRAILRGFVTPDRTVLIASTHRALAVSEKMVPGDGIADAAEVEAAAAIAAQRVVAFDMEAIALAEGSVISASMFGALAGAGVLPFGRAAFEAAISARGRGAETSLRAFDAGYEAALVGPQQDTPPERPQVREPDVPASLAEVWGKLKTRVEALPGPVAAFAVPGLRRVVDFQDLAFGAAYLDRIEGVLRLDSAEQAFRLTAAAAKYIANAMAYDDVIRVADLKTRSARFARIRSEMAVGEDQSLRLTEFMHPRAEEIVGLLPARTGARVQASAVWMSRIERWFCKGRRLRSDGVLAFGVLYALGGLRGYRTRTLRHAEEVAHLEEWLSKALVHVPQNYDLAVEVIHCRRLIKGYSDTHARGSSKFERVLAGVEIVAHRKDAADWARRLRDAALKDEDGTVLDGALATIRTFA